VAQLVKAKKRVVQHPGQRIVDAIESLSQPVTLILLPNGKQLDDLLSTFPYNAQGELLFDANRRELMDSYLGEVLRLTHNLVASVGTVIDHTRGILKESWPARESLVRVEFERERSAFTQDGRLMLVQGLRNYVLHYRLPSMLGRLQGTAEEMHGSVLLSTKALLEWSHWSAASKLYLRRAGEDISLRSLVQDYVQGAATLTAIVIKAARETERRPLRQWSRLARAHDALVVQLRSLPAQPPPLADRID
jgi:hypothetical protein